MAMRPPNQPLLSPDGRFYWDGVEWVAVAAMQPVVQPQPYYMAQMPAQAPQPYYAPQPMFVESAQAAGPRNGIGTAAGVLGIIAGVLMFIPFADYLAIVLGVLAVIFGAVGISRANRRGGLGKGMAVTGLVLGLIAVVVSVVLIIAFYAVLLRTQSIGAFLI